MKNHETSTGNQISPGLFGEIMGSFAAAVQASTPAQLQYWVGKKSELREIATQLLAYPTAHWPAFEPLTIIPIKSEPYIKSSFWDESGPVPLWLPDRLIDLLHFYTPETIPPFEGALVKTRLLKTVRDREISERFGESRFFSLTEVCGILSLLLRAQPHGEAGYLETGGVLTQNLFSVKLEGGRQGEIMVSFLPSDQRWHCLPSTSLWGESKILDARWPPRSCIFSRSPRVEIGAL